MCVGSMGISKTEHRLLHPPRSVPTRACEHASFIHKHLLNTQDTQRWTLSHRCSLLGMNLSLLLTQHVTTPLNHNSFNHMHVCVCMEFITHSFTYFATQQWLCIKKNKAESISSCSGLLIGPKSILANCSHLSFLFSSLLPSLSLSPLPFSPPLPSPVLSFDKVLLS